MVVAALMLGVVLLLTMPSVLAVFGVAFIRSDYFVLAPTLYLLGIPPFAASLYHLRSGRRRP